MFGWLGRWRRRRRIDRQLAVATCRFCGRAMLDPCDTDMNDARGSNDAWGGRMFWMRCGNCKNVFHRGCAAGQEKCPTCGPGRKRHWIAEVYFSSTGRIVASCELRDL